MNEKVKTHGVPRSSLWPKTKREFEKNNPKVCAICRKKKGVQLHHKKPFHLHPELELEPSNLVWLCENQKDISCHLIFGHFGNFKDKYNPRIDADIKLWNERLTKKEKMM